MTQKLLAHWLFILVLATIALVVISFLEPHYLKLQTASDAATFRAELTGTGRTIAAALCDVVFAASYGVLIAIWIVAVGGRPAAVWFGVVSIGGAAFLDEVENSLLIRNAASHGTVTDGWIDAMRSVGMFKLALLVLGGVILIGLLICRVVATDRPDAQHEPRGES